MIAVNDGSVGPDFERALLAGFQRINHFLVREAVK